MSYGCGGVRDGNKLELLAIVQFSSSFFVTFDIFSVLNYFKYS